MTTESLFGGEPLPITLEAQIECVEREIRQRDRVYPRLVGKGDMTQHFADEQVAGMKAVLRTLKGLADAAEADRRLEAAERAQQFTDRTGVPYPQHCVQKAACAGLSSCPRDPACVD